MLFHDLITFLPSAHSPDNSTSSIPVTQKKYIMTSLQIHLPWHFGKFFYRQGSISGWMDLRSGVNGSGFLDSSVTAVIYFLEIKPSWLSPRELIAFCSET